MNTDNSEQLWALTILPVGSSIRQAVQVLNETSLKIVLIVDASKSLVGTISDGDIRRGLLRGLDLSDSVESILQREPIVVPPNMTREIVVQLMSTNRIYQIPIVDAQSHLLGLHLWDEVISSPSRPNVMIIMAGGKGTRLHPLTSNCPKPLLDVGGKPILKHIIDRAKLQGFSHFIIAINYLGEMIEDYFGTGENFGVKIEYIREVLPLGTAGALSLLTPLPNLPFVVTNGDVITDIDYGELIDFHVEQSAVATMAVRLQEWQNPFGVVKIRDFDIYEYNEKPLVRSYINAGVYVLCDSSIQSLTEGVACDMPEIFQRLINNSERVVAYPVHEGWLDVGRPKDFSEASKKFSTFDIDDKGKTL